MGAGTEQGWKEQRNRKGDVIPVRKPTEFVLYMQRKEVYLIKILMPC